jgi:hypothetical protein
MMAGVSFSPCEPTFCGWGHDAPGKLTIPARKTMLDRCGGRRFSSIPVTDHENKKNKVMKLKGLKHPFNLSTTNL